MEQKHTKNCIYTVFCTLFFVLCLVPLAAMAVFGASKPAANETLAAPPRLVRGGSFNEAVLSDTAAYFADRFALRQELVTANSALHMGVLDESPVKSVLAGEDGWLFYADTLADFTGTSAMTGREIFCAARSLRLMQEYANACGAKFVFAAAPNKNSLFSEKMPNNYKKTGEKSNAERLYAELDAQNVVYCDLHSALSGAENTYHKTDSHWNGYGSALAHDALMQTLGKEQRLADEEFESRPFAGDLYQMLFPASQSYERSPTLARERTFAYAAPIRAADDMRIDTVCDAASGSLLMFRDSFGNAWHEDLAESFAAACFSRAAPYDLTMLHETNADTLVIELVERNLHDLAQKAPIMPAPVRTCAAEAAADDAETELKATDDGAVDGCVRYGGRITWERMDTDSPVYLELDGTVYEAVPHGDGRFSLYAPDAASMQVLACSGGVLYALD